MVNPVMIFQTTFVVEDDNQCHPQVKFSCQRTMVYSVVTTIKQYIAVSLVPARRIEFVYHTIRQTTVISQFLSVTEFYYGSFLSVSVSEMQSADR